MTANTILADGLKSTLGLLQTTIADFSDADMFARPTPAANHATWQLGHLAFFDVMVAELVAPGKVPPTPADYKEKFGSKNTSNNDAASFPGKQELLNIIAAAHVAITEYVVSAPAIDFDKPAPEAFRNWVPTMGHLLLAVSSHTNMHIGQFQVIRRALGKPILF